MTFTKEEYLEVLLEEARNTIQFLHSCLTEPHVPGTSGGYTYAYPFMTKTFLDRLEKVLPERHYCIHSKFDPNCENCAQGQRSREIVGEWERCEASEEGEQCIYKRGHWQAHKYEMTMER